MIQRDIFPQRGSESAAKPDYALPTIEQVATKLTSAVLTAGTDFTVSAGVAGAALTIKLPIAPIVGNYGRTARFGNSTLVFGGALATTLATEVAFVANSSNSAGDVTGLSNGEYMVDYETGIVYGKRADNATTGTATYSYLAKIGGATAAGGPTYPTYTNTRPAAILTGDYADATYVLGAAGYNQLQIIGNFTKGDLSSCEILVEQSFDGVLYGSISIQVNDSGIPASKLYPAPYQLLADGNFIISTGVTANYVRIKVKGTGDPTGSSLAMQVGLAYV